MIFLLFVLFLSVVAQASALCLNIPECNTLPLWNFSVENCKKNLRDTCPAWYEMSVAFWAIYLGFPIGLHAHAHAGPLTGMV